MVFSNCLNSQLSSACIGIIGTACVLIPLLIDTRSNAAFILTTEEDTKEYSLLQQNSFSTQFEARLRLCSLCSNECVILSLFVFITIGFILLFYIICNIL